ncbi:hypothetical protein, partial [Pseudorhodoplanes sp.]|uniref:hypothetical protein n=1 Tax=Pseudorhodoplanes sp. TaxID=1934341 RepID=UPI003D0ABC1B
MDCPKISDTIIFADDAQLAAKLSCAFARRGSYLPVCDGPRIQRPDKDAEVVRRHNLVARSKSKNVFVAGLSDESADLMRLSVSRAKGIQFRRIDSDIDLPTMSSNIDQEPLVWGADRIGIGLLQALRERRGIKFEKHSSPTHSVPSKSGHLVVCEDGEEISQVIAANYAYALDAGLHLIPAVTRERVDDILEAFYKLSDKDSGVSPAEAQRRLREELLTMCGSLPIPEKGSITFIGGLPYGFSYPEYPTTHLFDYPDLGCAVVNGFAAEQEGTAGTGVVTLVDPGTTPAPEIEAAVRLLEPRRAFVRVYKDGGANVRHVSEMLEHFPFDLLVIATHCGDSNGYRWTYEFTDSEGIARVLVVDIAIGIARTDDPEMLKVGQFIRFISLDGVDWSDPGAKAKLHVGTAMWDFTRLTAQGPNELKPVKKETVPRVVGSSAMKMSDSNLLFAFQTIADVGTPVIANNACLSWHRLAGDMTFAGARAYVGTLFEVLPFEAEAVVLKILDKHWGKPLPVAVWAAQRDVYQSVPRSPYVVSGVFPQRVRVIAINYPLKIYRRLARGLTAWAARRI